VSIRTQIAAKRGPNQINRRGIAECIERGADDINAFAEDFLDTEGHIGQIRWWNRECEDGTRKMEAKESALACANRWGKTFSVGVKLLHSAFYQKRPDKYQFDAQGRFRPYRAINVAMSLDQSMLAWNEAYGLAMKSKRFQQFVVNVVGPPFPCLQLSNAPSGHDRIISEVWARSTAHKAKFLLGKSFNFLNYDEAAFDADGEYILDSVLRMRMADQAGVIDMTSSPNGKNWFYRFYQMGQSNDPFFFSRRGPVWENPHTDHEHIRRTMQKMSASWRQQNVEGNFADFTMIFPADAVMRCTASQDYAHLLPVSMGYDIEYLTQSGSQGDEVYATKVKSKKKHRYVIGVDLARKRDKTVVTVLQLGPPHRLVRIEEKGKTSWSEIYQFVTDIARAYGNAPGWADSTGIGDAPVEAMQSDPYNLNITGYNLAGGASKENLIVEAQTAIQDTAVLFPHIPELVDQLIYYEWQDKNLQTDYVFSLALAIHGANEILEKENPTILDSPDGMFYVTRRTESGLLVAGSRPVETKDTLYVPHQYDPRRDFTPDDDDDDALLLARAIL
jgi:hypothetical protein